MEWTSRSNPLATERGVIASDSLASYTLTRLELEAWVDKIMYEEGQRFLLEVPKATHLTDESPLDLNYYLRHRMENIRRIWLTARIDALALAHSLSDARRMKTT